MQQDDIDTGTGAGNTAASPFPLYRRLDLAVAAWLASVPSALRGLEAAVGERVMHLRRAGTPPERVIVAIKRATHEALARELPRAEGALETDAAREDATRAVVSQVVTAAVKAYYAR